MSDQTPTPDARECACPPNTMLVTCPRHGDASRRHGAPSSSLPDSGERDRRIEAKDRKIAELEGVVRSLERDLAAARRGEPAPGQFVSVAANKAMAAPSSPPADGEGDDELRALARKVDAGAHVYTIAARRYVRSTIELTDAGREVLDAHS